jgi:hypothetical protein
MSLETCPTCRKMISTEAQSCPKCGQPLKEGWIQKVRSRRQRMIAISMAICLATVGSCVALTFISGSGSASQPISLAQYGTDWPFTRSSGTLSCIDAKPGGVPRPYVVVEFDGTKYGLNGAAQGVGGYRSADEIRKRDADGLFTVGKVHRLIEDGLALCRRSY